MASISHIRLQAVTHHLCAEFTESKIQKFRDMGESRISLELFGGGKKAWLQLWMVPQCAGIYLADKAPTSSDAGAGNFVRALRRYVGNARISDFQLDNSDRILTMKLRANALPYSLIYEVFGANPNLYLLDGDGRILVQSRSVSSGGRNLHPGESYQRPEQNQPGGGAPSAVEEISAVFDLSLHKAIEDELTRQLNTLRSRDAKANQTRPLRREIKRLKRLSARLQADIDRAGDPDTLRNHGHVLGAYMATLKKGAQSVTLDNPGIEGLPETVVIPLDPARSPQDNLQHIYRRARRAERTRKEATSRLGEARAALAKTLEELEVLENSSHEELQRENADGDAAQKTKNPRRPALAKGLEKVAHVHHGEDGSLILVGKNAKSNDQLLRRFAHGNDHWLHVRDGSGSHVVVRPPPGTEASDATLRKAASLAAGFSSLRTESQVDVIWTQCKYVRSTKGNAPGAVHISRSSTLRVAPNRPSRG